MKKILGALSVFIALGIAWYIFSDGGLNLGAAKKQIVQTAQDAVVSNAAPEDVAALALKAISLTQGEHGAELWRLKADWGNMRRRDNVMELEKPHFTYYMPPDNKAVTITSSKGEIEQEEQKIRFIDSVVATYDGRTLHAPEMLYFGKSRELVCPQGGRVEGEGYEGSANRIVWRVNEQIIESLGNVDVSFENDIFTTQPEDAGTPGAHKRPGAKNAQG
ncbi:exported hypothetical protein [uncultured delta proteobacterium]|uniref:LPS export ABC transporter periplasmic protein LptC n=1 Tax=uncultured delta proteobacterium TaxID=34034 RepID=A0A212J3G4_9DELT|nr:exported hypothetical protein [uncultured delta proteobacterium]